MGEPQQFARASWFLLVGSIFAFFAALLLIIAFSSPFWLESYLETYSEFVRMGLWDVCFNNYRHPPYQHDELFNGCHWIFSYKYQNIREWLQPGWLIFVQAAISLAIIFSLLSLSFISIVLMRYLLKFEVFILGAAFICEVITAFTVFLGVSVFGGLCFDRSWLQYPLFNHLSWGYGLAVVSCFFHAISAGYLLAETFRAREHRKRASNLVYNMQPRF